VLIKLMTYLESNFCPLIKHSQKSMVDLITERTAENSRQIHLRYTTLGMPSGVMPTQRCFWCRGMVVILVLGLCHFRGCRWNHSQNKLTWAAHGDTRTVRPGTNIHFTMHLKNKRRSYAC